jgi:hypothetical protein
VRELLRHDNIDPNLIKIDTNEMDDEINYDGTPLHFAAEKGYEKVVRELLQHWNINPNVVLVKRTDEVGFPCPTPLHLAALNCFPEVVRMLLEHTSINYRIKNKRGETALDMALDFAWDVYNTGGVGAIQTCRAFFDRTDCSVTICLKLLKRVLSSEGMKNFFENILDLLNCKPIATYLASRGNTEDMDRILVKLLDSGNIDDLENIFKMLNCKPIAIYLASKGKTEDIDRILRPIRPAITKKFPHVFNPKFSLQREIGHIYKGTVKHSAAYYEKRIHFLCTAWKNTQAKYGNLEKKYDNLEKKYDNLKKKMDSLGISEATLRKRKFPFPSHHDAFSKKEKKH